MAVQINDLLLELTEYIERRLLEERSHDRWEGLHHECIYHQDHAACEGKDELLQKADFYAKTAQEHWFELFDAFYEGFDGAKGHSKALAASGVAPGRPPFSAPDYTGHTNFTLLTAQELNPLLEILHDLFLYTDASEEAGMLTHECGEHNDKKACNDERAAQKHRSDIRKEENVDYGRISHDYSHRKLGKNEIHPMGAIGYVPSDPFTVEGYARSQADHAVTSILSAAPKTTPATPAPPSPPAPPHREPWEEWEPEGGWPLDPFDEEVDEKLRGISGSVDDILASLHPLLKKE